MKKEPIYFSFSGPPPMSRYAWGRSCKWKILQQKFLHNKWRVVSTDGFDPFTEKFKLDELPKTGGERV